MQKISIRRMYFLCLIFFLPSLNYAQESIPGKAIICYGSNTGIPSHTIKKTDNLRHETSLEASSIFEVTYIGFSEEAKKAFQFAIAIWSKELNSNIPIRITATLDSLPGNFLATTRATKLYRGFQGAVRSDIWYPVALAEKIMGKELNESNASDIEISLSKNTKWYFGVDGDTPTGYTDLISIVLHEIAHGLGFSSSANLKDDSGYLRDENYLSIYDLLLENNQRTRLSIFPDPSKNLQEQLTSDKLFIYSPSSFASNDRYPKLFAPAFFIAGSSISHLDEVEYPAGDPNALMTPYFSMSESNHLLGNILHGVLLDMGWGDQPAEPYKVIIYPNPSNGIYNLKIQMPVSINSFDLSILDLTGRTVIDQTTFTNESLDRIDLSGWPNGIYILNIKTPEINIIKKITLLK